MCGIVGYVGNKPVVDILLDGLCEEVKKHLPKCKKVKNHCRNN